MSNLQPIVIVVDVPEDQATAVEAAAGSVVRTLQDNDVTVTAATFAGRSLLPSPVENLRAAIDALGKLTKGGRPTAADLSAAVATVEEAARTVEGYGPTGGLDQIDTATAAAAATAGTEPGETRFALAAEPAPDEPAA